MRLVTFEHQGRRSVGFLDGSDVVDAGSVHPSLGADMGALLALLDREPGWARQLAVQAAQRHPASAVRLLAPVLAPRKFTGIGMNYGSFRAAVQRLQVPMPPGQVWFSRPLSAVAGPGAAIHAPRNSAALDFEGELAVVIGRRCRAVTREAAAAVIGGYTISNDVTVRDWAARAPLLGKSFDTHAPIGPWIVTPDELGDPHRLALRTWVNGELRQDGNTADMLLDCYALVELLSAVCTLEPGDVILTGTPDGCGVLHAPPRFLQPGDRVRIEIDGIGALENHVVPEPA